MRSLGISQMGMHRRPSVWTPRNLGAGIMLWAQAGAGEGLTLNPVMPAFTPSGSSPPALGISGAPTGPTDLRIECVVGGALATATYRASLDGGTTWLATAPTSANVSIGPFSVTMGVGPYTNNNVWISRSQVSAISDISGSGNSMANATSATQPRTKYVGGRLHLDFVGVSKQFLMTSAMPKPSSYTLFIMGTKNSAAAVAQWMCGSNNPAGSSVGCWAVVGVNALAGALQYAFSNGVASATSYRTPAVLADATPFSYVTGYKAGDNSQTLNRVNGASQAMTLIAAAGSTALGGTAYQFAIGRLGQYPTSETWDGTIRECMIINRQLSATEFRQLYDYSVRENGA